MEVVLITIGVVAVVAAVTARDRPNEAVVKAFVEAQQLNARMPFRALD